MGPLSVDAKGESGLAMMQPTGVVKKGRLVGIVSLQASTFGLPSLA